TSKVGSQTTSNVGSIGTLRYTFRSGDSVILDASRNHGSGSGDMYAYIPTSDFAGTKTSDFVYLYAHFGTTDNSQAGFEEWALVSAAPHSRDKRAVSYYRFFLRWPSPRNICGDVTRGSWATYGFHEFILRSLAEATVTVASVFFSNRMAQCCKRSRLTRNLAPAYVRTSTRDEGIQRFGQPRAGPAHLQLHWSAARPGYD